MWLMAHSAVRQGGCGPGGGVKIFRPSNATLRYLALLWVTGDHPFPAPTPYPPYPYPATSSEPAGFRLIRMLTISVSFQKLAFGTRPGLIYREWEEGPLFFKNMDTKKILAASPAVAKLLEDADRISTGIIKLVGVEGQKSGLDPVAAAPAMLLSQITSLLALMETLGKHGAVLPGSVAVLEEQLNRAALDIVREVRKAGN